MSYLIAAALFVASVASALSLFCARSAFRSWKHCAAESNRPSMTSLRAELAEMRDELGKTHAVLKRIQGRQYKAEQRGAHADDDDDVKQRPGESAEQWKARVRPKLITAKGAKHG